MKINNNPYNMPDRAQHKQTRVYTQNSNNHFRNDSVENIPIYTPQQARTSINQNIVMKRSTINIQEIPGSYRPPYYPTVINEMKHYLPSPKSQNSSSAANLQSFQAQNNMHYPPTEKKQSSHQLPLRQSLGIMLESKEVNEKIQILTQAIKYNEKRITQLQRHSNGSSILPNYSKLSEHEQIHQIQKSDSYKSLFKNQSEENFRKFKDDMNHFREQMKQIVKNNQKIVNQKVKQSLDISKTKTSEIISLSSNCEHNNEQLTRVKKQLDAVRLQLDEKIKKNHDFITTVVARIEREVHNNLNFPPQYKSSGIKCTNTAILLRFVQCFKVRKNVSHSSTSLKSGEVKVTIADNTYYIDHEGYLLDKDQCYLIDGRGMQVKLQDKHIKLLKQQGVIV